jgi:hypothetical protein
MGAYVNISSTSSLEFYIDCGRVNNLHLIDSYGCFHLKCIGYGRDDWSNALDRY